MPDKIHVQLFGHFRLERNGKPVEIGLRSSQALLAYLILKPEQSSNREQVADVLWPKTADAKANLRNSLYQLRNAVGSDLILSTQDGLALNPEIAIRTDVDPFLETKPAELEPAALMAVLEASQGELLTDLYDDWIMAERQRINLQKDSWYEALIGRLERADRHSDVIVWAEKWIYDSGAVEPAYRALMSAYAAMGNNSKVGEVYQRCQTDLKREFGVKPSKATSALFDQILAREGGAPAQSWSAAEPKQGSGQVKGLRRRAQKALVWLGLAVGLIVVGFTLFNSGANLSWQVDAETKLQDLIGFSFTNNQGASRFSSALYQDRPSVDLVPRFLRVSEQGRILISSVDGQDYGEIQVEGLYVMGASWIQANGQILVWADPRGDVSNLGQGDFYTVDADGKVIEQLTFTQESEPKGRPDMTDDGEFIVYATGEAVNILEVASGKVSTIVPSDGGLSWVVSAHWSPDEQQVVYMRITPACGGCEQTARLTVVDRDGQAAVEVYVSEPTDRLTLQVSSVGFSPDGHMLGFEDMGAKTIPIAGEGVPTPASGDIWYWLPTYFPQWNAGS